MSFRLVDLHGRSVWLFEQGSGAPLVYLHGLADLHGASSEPLEFHQKLAENFSIVAPAHPGCSKTEENEDIDTIEDVVFHYLELFDKLGLEKINLVGSNLGGWIAAEIAVRHPDKLLSLSLIGAPGLFIPGDPIADLFWEAHPVDGTSLSTLRALLFGNSECEVARQLFPDGRGEIEQELLRYKTYRLLSRIGFNPPYLHHRLLKNRLYRYTAPALVVHGSLDSLVPKSHAKAYGDSLGNARLEMMDGCGHSPHIEKPEQTVNLLLKFIKKSAENHISGPFYLLS